MHHLFVILFDSKKFWGLSLKHDKRLCFLWFNKHLSFIKGLSHQDMENLCLLVIYGVTCYTLNTPRNL